jgi:hypothetical protein
MVRGVERQRLLEKTQKTAAPLLNNLGKIEESVTKA